jgi:hypothetical protein
MFHRSLREFGTDVIGLFNDELHDQTKQFVVAALVSVRENLVQTYYRNHASSFRENVYHEVH